MKFLVLLTLLLFSSLIEASYLRTIRIGSYHNQETAQRGLEKLQNFVAKHPNLIALQNSGNFRFKYRKSGRYYITCAEPLRDRETLQEVLDTIRLAYPDAYVTKLKDYKETTQQKNSFKKKVYKHKVKKEVIKKHSKTYTTTHTQVKEKQEKNETLLKELKDDAGVNIYKVLFFIMLILLMLFFALAFYYRRKFLKTELHDRASCQTQEQTMEEVKQKEQLVSYVSHELRSPMTAIMGFTNLVLDTNLSKIQRDYLEKIEQSSTYMLSLLNDILDLSKIEADKLKIEKAEFNINDILNYVYNVIAVQAKHNNLNIIVAIEPDVPSHVVGDSLRVGQILINLVNNAVKFTKDGEIILSVRKLDDADEDNITLEFAISDTGIGMSQDQLKRLFSSYYQATDSISREFGGTGLGLAISKKLIELMGGEIDVESQKGIGTTFTFTLNFSLKDAENKRQYRLPSAKLLNKSVLLVDSQNKNAIPLMQAFSYFKYKTHNIVSFEKTDIDFDEEKFDIIIVHILMLSRIAIEKLKHIKKYNNNVKIVILSDLHSTVNDALVEELVIDGYLKTPIIIQSVLNLITDLYVEKHSVVLRQKQTLREQLLAFKNKKILVVEDNELNHKVIAGMMAKTGIEVNFVHDGKMAVELLQNGTKVDLILMDINMPVMDGYEAVKEIRKSKALDNVPILALSADVSADAIRKSFKSGMQGHISKPVSAAELYSKIIELFSSKKVKIMNKEEDTQVSKENDNEDLDTEMGLERCDNDIKTYKRILEDFHSMYVNSGAALEDLCEHNECKKARYLLMDIKDAAMNIGAYNLSEYCNKMEHLFEKNDVITAENYKKYLQEYETLLVKVFQVIDKYLNEKH